MVFLTFCDSYLLSISQQLFVDLTKYHREGRPWYGDDDVIEKWAGWLR